MLDLLLNHLSSGPGAYDNEEKTNFRYVLDQRPMSLRGYTFNARTEKRKTFDVKVIRPTALLNGFLSSQAKPSSYSFFSVPVD